MLSGFHSCDSILASILEMPRCGRKKIAPFMIGITFVIRANSQLLALPGACRETENLKRQPFTKQSARRSRLVKQATE